MKTIYHKDPENLKMTVTRSFNATQELVWKAWTTAEILEQWWAPKPFKAKSARMDFSVGGSWLYCMLGPNGEAFWGLTEYHAIEPMHTVAGIDFFCDENGVRNEALPATHWNYHFEELNGITTVTVEMKFQSQEAMQQMAEMGFETGFDMALDNLEAWLAAQ
jgi:uncharacterized protein YndB with AHSA1/START domain